jgi:monoterpene epsilon-lactone hydrolase
MPEARVVIAGESAGGNLAAALLLRLRDAGDSNPLAGVLFSGVFDARKERYTSGSWVDNAPSDHTLSRALGTERYNIYAGSHAPDDPGISSVAADLAGLPPLLVMASSTEMLLDDSIGFATKAGRAGVETVLQIWPGMHHSWPNLAGLPPEANEAVDRAAFILRVAEGRVVDGSALTDDPNVLKMLPPLQSNPEAS